MAITRETVARIAELAQLDLSTDEAEAMVRDLNAIVEYVGQLNRLDLTEDAPGSDSSTLPWRAGSDEAAPELGWRPDEVRPSLSQAQALSNAPEAEAGMFRVPRIMERG